MNEPRRWLDEPRNVTRLVYSLYAVCAVLLGLDLFLHKHVHFEFEHWVGFYPLAGFVAYCMIVQSARLLRRVLRRDEDYYGEAEEGEDG